MTRPIDKVNAFASLSSTHDLAVSLAVENATDRGEREPEDYWSDAADAYWVGILAEAEDTIEGDSRAVAVLRVIEEQVRDDAASSGRADA